ncbi:hypothetical protein IEN85_07880 [Pelagicoccus sp. NFK12]|uniref:DUF4878 domain-containing protein n=1 Tax=Pelagicoccus enzymogenes TaxID=2773457 RepID=A0A927F7K3_9BACT|nr:hypothetical protein [Pelagicoccus enzymogenes]MBD5779410.1 hypothetical protein [Pelagicoccus enzymogenes]MDQ8200591.1 hypothetical protein [Pelagicoccus enzymogenes]
MQKKLLSSIVAITLFIGGSLVQADTAEETPKQALKEIVELYKKNDWEHLVKERCLEARHAQSEAAVQDLVNSLSSQFSDAETLDALVASYEAALSAEPQIESEGTVAIFASEMGSVRLSKMDNGAWGLRF